MKNHFSKLFIVISLLFVSSMANANLIANGSFDSGTTSWHDASGNGNVSFGSGVAILNAGNGTDPFSSILVQGDDGSFSFSSPISITANFSLLSFDAWIGSNNIDSSESGTSSFSDSFNVAVYDAFDNAFDLTLFEISIDKSLTNFTLDLSSLIGRKVAFSFELADENDGYNLAVGIDNVLLKSAASTIPEPSILLLMLAGLVMVRLFGVRQ